MQARSPGTVRSLAAILSACIAYGIGMGLTLPLLSLILERMGEPGAVNGLNLATGGLAAVLVTPFVPRLIVRFGVAGLLILSLVVSSASLIALYEAPSLWLWFPCRFVLSSAFNALFVITEFWINQLADQQTRGRYVALYAVCLSGSFGIGPAILQLIGTHGIGPFVMGAGLLLLAVFPIALARRNAPAISDTGSHTVFSIVRSAPLAFAAAFVFGAIDAGMAGLFPVYAVRSGYSEARAALSVTAIAIGSVVFQYPIGALADRMNRTTLLGLCASTGIVGAILVPFLIQSPAATYLLLFVWGGLILGVYSIGLTLLGERFKGPDLANANAGFVIAYSLGLLVGPAGEGVALDLWNPHGLLVVLGGICAVYSALLLVFRRRDLSSP